MTVGCDKGIGTLHTSTLMQNLSSSTANRKLNLLGAYFLLEGRQMVKQKRVKASVREFIVMHSQPCYLSSFYCSCLTSARRTTVWGRCPATCAPGSAAAAPRAGQSVGPRARPAAAWLHRVRGPRLRTCATGAGRRRPRDPLLHHPLLFLSSI